MYNPMRLDGQRIMITGASSGLGRACAQVISQLGGEVVLVARDEVRLGETLSSMDGDGHQVEAFDLAETEAIPAWIKDVVARGGKPLTGLVHCAGIEITLPVRTMKLADYERMMNINVTAAFALAKGFRQRGVCLPPASIVLISSVSAIKARPGMVAYAAGKAALVGMARSLAVELAREHIRVNVLTAGLVQTEMAKTVLHHMTESQVAELVGEHLLGLGKPQDVAHSVAFLLAETGRWITGSNLVVDGGYSIH
ncbi:MAG: SDR family oxidoreductase [Anderseniella sp.]|jgi:NAD(P)-dependent dehydrogenase (short-subunit alcohol dehydrogenase family)|nr:SDR family oxidoreductase [Anderseniella sp.]